MQKVSVIVPTYNRAGYLKEALESILRQDYQNIEIIVTDNVSTDNTTDVVKSLLDDRIIYFKHSKNIGMAGNYNKALELSVGEYIHIFSDDDIMLAGCISQKVKVFNEFPTVGLVHSDINIINGEGNISYNDNWAKGAWKKWNDLHKHNQFFSKKVYHKYLYRIRNFITMPSVMIRRAAIDKVGNMDIQLKYIIDWDYWLKITLFYDAYYLNVKLVSYRLHSNNLYKEMEDSEDIKDYKTMINNIDTLFPQHTIKNNFFHEILRKGGYYTNYSLINPLNYIIKSALPFIPFKKIKQRIDKIVSS